MKAAISPSAGPCCYEVGHHVRRVARTRLADADACFIEKDGRVFFDLWTANRNQLIAAGIRPDAVEIAGSVQHLRPTILEPPPRWCRRRAVCAVRGADGLRC